MRKARKTLSQLLVLSLFCLLASCQSQKFKEAQKLGGKEISAKTLNLGHDTYLRYCFQCHGVQGDGKGPASYGMNPQPRNFQQGVFKFGSVTSGDLPTDEDLKKTIRFGLKGTPMLPWDLSDNQLDAVVHYLKTFSPVWKTDPSGKAQETTVDPFGTEKRQEAILLGKKIYHGLAQCQQCHPHYASSQEIRDYSKELIGSELNSDRPRPDLSVLQDSSYGHKILPPDFTRHSLKKGGDVVSLYRLIGAGVGGTPMPAWKSMLSPEGYEAESERNLWALAYYVSSLDELKDKPVARRSFFNELNAKRKPETQSKTPSRSQ